MKTSSRSTSRASKPLPPSAEKSVSAKADSSRGAGPGNISARDLELLVETCENPPEPNAALLQAAREYFSR
jgi:hypothetical protein